MKIIKTSNNYKIQLSKKEWSNIGRQSGWIKISEVDPRQRSGLTELFDLKDELIGDLGELQNIDPKNTEESDKVFESINLKLEKLKKDNWVVSMDAEMQASVQMLQNELQGKDPVGFNTALMKFYNKEIEEKKKQIELLDRMS
jgi:hypothetical protein